MDLQTEVYVWQAFTALFAVMCLIGRMQYKSMSILQDKTADLVDEYEKTSERLIHTMHGHESNFNDMKELYEVLESKFIEQKQELDRYRNLFPNS